MGLFVLVAGDEMACRQGCFLLGVDRRVNGEQREDSCKGGRKDGQHLNGWTDGRDVGEMTDSCLRVIYGCLRGKRLKGNGKKKVIGKIYTTFQSAVAGQL